MVVPHRFWPVKTQKFGSFAGPRPKRTVPFMGSINSMWQRNNHYPNPDNFRLSRIELATFRFLEHTPAGLFILEYNVLVVWIISTSSIRYHVFQSKTRLWSYIFIHLFLRELVESTKSSYVQNTQLRTENKLWLLSSLNTIILTFSQTFVFTWHCLKPRH